MTIREVGHFLIGDCVAYRDLVLEKSEDVGWKRGLSVDQEFQSTTFRQLCAGSPEEAKKTDTVNQFSATRPVRSTYVLLHNGCS